MQPVLHRHARRSAFRRGARQRFNLRTDNNRGLRSSPSFASYSVLEVCALSQQRGCGHTSSCAENWTLDVCCWMFARQRASGPVAQRLEQGIIIRCRDLANESRPRKSREGKRNKMKEREAGAVNWLSTAWLGLNGPKATARQGGWGFVDPG